MAEELVGFKIVINGQEKVVKSLGEMKQLLKEANFELLSAQKNFGEYSNEAVQAAKKVATLKDGLQEAGETAQLFDPGKKFQAFAGALSAAAGGISAFQGALGLLGTESENVQKTLLKVQSALALSQGLSTIADSAKDFQRLAAVIQSTTIYQKAYNFVLYGTTSAQKALQVSTVATSTAMRVLRGVMASIGIGALIFGVTTLITKIMEWTDRASDNEKALKKQAEATKILNQDIDNEIALLTALGNQEDKIADKRKEQINNNLNDLRDRLKSVGKLTQEEQAEYRKLVTELKVIDINEAKRKENLLQEETKKRQEQNKKVVEDRKAANKEIEQADADLFQKIQQISDELFLSEIKNNKEREEVKIATQYERDKKEIEDSKGTQEQKNAALLLLKQKYFADLKVLEDAETEEQVIASQNELTNITNGLIAEEELNLSYLERDKKLKEEYRQADLEATIDLQNKKFDAVNAGLNLLESLSGRNEAIGNIFFAIQKAIEIGRIVTSTSAAIAKVTADTASIPTLIPPGIPNPAFPIAVATGAKKILGLKIGAAASIANIIASSISKFKSGGSVAGGGSDLGQASVSAPISPSQSLINTRTLLNADAIGRLSSATNRAYVVESDVTNSQERIRRINRAARLG